ncbi:MAG: hypothetical protein MJA84_09205, partial [Firmicutes bacterium]|nr:hypothetical protein [Bacillota bacterium]
MERRNTSGGTIKRKGRGAVSNRTGRFEPTVRERVDDGWSVAGWSASDPTEEPAPQTIVQPDSSKEIIARNQSPDVPFDRS